MISGKKILIGITGSIAAYKMVHLVRLLVKAGAEVKVVMTPAATDFVAPLTLSTLAHHPVQSELFKEGAWANHVMLGRWADLFLVAPLSCNTLAKMANGHCDNLLLATYLSATCPVWVAPAMDNDMWQHPAIQHNLNSLRSHGCHVLPVGFGELASGLTGNGRMAEPEQMVAEMESFFNGQNSFSGKKVLITAGPTYEAIDPVRFIGNHSSGKMGYALAETIARKGGAVTLVSGPVSLAVPAGVELVRVQSAAEMHDACMKRQADYDIAILSAAVADYTPEEVAAEKIKKSEAGLTLTLRKTPDILASLGAAKKKGQLLVGFALETNNELANARKKLESKNADMIVLNSLNDSGAGFGKPTNKITLVLDNGRELAFETKTKEAVAEDIAGQVLQMIS
ncbi:phosphopantothenoylcysteine decarboxylase / phosphopantothenate--cysteine ligase [Cnuella takakiae]|uniref:Coenzyme A biosynthesis bifunctional protein CoaBC n=1 Tax=Cnuella takakiae TaxID=1302690 RepID=A0A1M5C4I5_9BACT|nr:bifunctional phosphopantothenoylcysteine decarboxylase/phosphopantothenate--cysteine ligase CoaBC [Cnuella takakiae]OLY93626.1 phosphopantothenoylcysteine decarboxylase [Cnuella takakiae]SHF49615.1 phosphopantothenoylcysteine decarboxylase / phosphopantothenate--cysteine ligase [Cnuella takakiae]